MSKSMKKSTVEQKSLQDLVSLVFGRSAPEVASTAARLRKGIYAGGVITSLGLIGLVFLIFTSI